MLSSHFSGEMEEAYDIKRLRARCDICGVQNNFRNGFYDLKLGIDTAPGHYILISKHPISDAAADR